YDKQRGLKNKTVTEGESVTLECHISGHPQPTVTWYREDYKIESSMDFQITFKAGLARLVIREAFAEDSGRFTCTATNKAGSVSTSLPKPPNFSGSGLTSLRLKQFGPAHFECRLTPIGDPTMVVEWLHDGKPLEAANRLRMINEFGYCSLDYGVAYSRDSGVITCRATNKYGTDHTSATLIVKDEKSLVEESQLPEGRRGLQRIEEKAHFLSVLAVEMSDADDYSCALVEDESIKTTAKLTVEGEKHTALYHAVLLK
uniref:Ig-like domain-containing protein n=1 Tax=Athene cunicularia TaxID=194338 RepID=A0A663MBL2_ATHCN